MRRASFLPMFLLAGAVLAGCVEPDSSAAAGGGPAGSPANRPPGMAGSRVTLLGEGESGHVGPIGDPDGDPVAVQIRGVPPGLFVALVGDRLQLTLDYDAPVGDEGVARFTVELDDGRSRPVIEELVVRVVPLGWSERARWRPENGPGPRRGAVSFVSDGALYLLFGEEDGAAVVDAWRFDPTDTTWSPVALVGDVPAPGPGKRLVVGGGTFVHGGVGPDGEPLGDLHRITVEDATVLAFERIVQEGAPPPRAEHVLIADVSPSGDGRAEPRVVMYGGLGGTRDAPTALDDLWTMGLVDGSARWQPLAVDDVPPARVAIAVAHDAEAGRAILVGGRAGPTGAPLDATWTLDLRAPGGPRFAPVEVAAPPSPRSGAAAVWDPVVGRAFLVGGSGADGTARGDVLVLDERGATPRWIAIERSGAPALGRAAMALSWMLRPSEATPRTSLWIGAGEGLSSLHELAPQPGDGYRGW